MSLVRIQSAALNLKLRIMIKIRCKNCNIELESHPTRTKCCGCDNLTTLKGETITALDLTLVELLSNMGKKETKKILSNEDLAFQESRKNRKIRKLEFEIK
jgi:hypothetical protein